MIEEPSPSVATDPPMAGPIPELDAMGVRYSMEYGPARSRFIRIFQIPWTPAQWVGVVHREGQWLGVCCGTISAIRDRIMSALADGGWVTPRDLEGIIELLKSHDGFEEWFAEGFTPDGDTLTNPLYMLARVWEVVKTRRWASWMDVPAKKNPNRRLENAAHNLEESLRMYGFVQMYHSSGDHPESLDGLDKEAQRKAEFLHHRDVNLTLSRVLPALREFTDTLKWKVLLPIQGFGIVRKSDREVVLDTRGGPAIYLDEAEAQRVIGFWCTNDQDNAPKPEDFEIRALEVSMEHGIKFVEGSRDGQG